MLVAQHPPRRSRRALLTHRAPALGIAVEAVARKGMAYWIGTDTRGTASTLSEGLEAIKSRVIDEALENLPPGHARR